MGKRGKKAQAGKPKKASPKDVGKKLNALVKKLEEELKGADLFAPLPPTEDCAVCLVPLPRVKGKSAYNACCGNDICVACNRENKESINKQNEEKDAGKKLALTCPFCREPVPTTGLEHMRQLEARASLNDHVAINQLGVTFEDGVTLPKDDLRALDSYIRAAELGSDEACNNIAGFLREGIALSKDLEKFLLFIKIGALRGLVAARHNAGNYEYYDFGNHELGIRHWKIAAEAGSQLSLDSLKKIYNADGQMPGKEFISKEYMDSLYRVCHDAQEEVKSEEREKHCADKYSMKC